MNLCLHSSQFPSAPIILPLKGARAAEIERARSDALRLPPSAPADTDEWDQKFLILAPQTLPQTKVKAKA
jgi:hypothetical protein